MKKRKKRKSNAKRVILLLLSVEALLIIIGIVYLQLRPMVAEGVTIEAGTEPEIDEFLLYENREGSFVTDIKSLSLNIPGIYEVKIRIGGRIHTSSLEIVDKTAPTGSAMDKMVLLNETIQASDFISEIKDETEVNVSFLKEPDTSKPGEQEINLLLEDSGGNHTELKAKLTVLDIKNSVTIEAGSEMNITEKDFMDNDNYRLSLLTDLKALDIRKPMVHKIELSVDGRRVSGNLKVVDTTAPEFRVINKPIWNDENPPAITFVEEIKDASGVKVTYKETPDFTVPGEQEVTLVLEDEYGNAAEQRITITINMDTQPPQVMRVSDKTVYIGDPVAYRKGITVTDNKDQDLTFQVDSSKVDLYKEGTYKVNYTAEDKAGNKTKATANITVIKLVVTEDTLNEISDKVLKDITKSSMSKREKAQAIYSWVKRNVSYTGHSDKSDWIAEAYRGYKNGIGDCFTFFAVSQALLNRAEISNMMVTRVGGKTQHFWNLIDCGEGWYHFDTTPNKDKKNTFMLTDKEVAELTKSRGRNYYVYDKSLYPATPEK